MSNRFLISVATAALIAGTGFANAQGTGMGRDAGSAGSAAQQSAPSSERGGATSMQRDSGRESGGTTGMKGGESEQKSMGAEKGQRAEDQKKGGKDMKAEGREGRQDKDMPPQFEPPGNIVFLSVDKGTGAVLPGDTTGGIREAFIAGTQPGSEIH